MTTYAALQGQDASLIRKALGGALFLGDTDADPITNLTTYTAGPPPVIDLVDLGEMGYTDLGLLTDDGIGFENENSTSDTTSWQQTAPTRRDTVTDSDTLTVVAQETNIQSLKLFTGAALTGSELAAQTGELQIEKPERPTSRRYRALALAVDGEGADEFFIGRFYPSLGVNGRNGQRFGKGDDPISYGVTLTSYVDAALGYSMKWIFGGNGWKAKAAAMGFAVPA